MESKINYVITQTGELENFNEINFPRRIYLFVSDQNVGNTLDIKLTYVSFKLSPSVNSVECCGLDYEQLTTQGGVDEVIYEADVDNSGKLISLLKYQGFEDGSTLCVDLTFTDGWSESQMESSKPVYMETAEQGHPIGTVTKNLVNGNDIFNYIDSSGVCYEGNYADSPIVLIPTSSPSNDASSSDQLLTEDFKLPFVTKLNNKYYYSSIPNNIVSVDSIEEGEQTPTPVDSSSPTPTPTDTPTIPYGITDSIGNLIISENDINVIYKLPADADTPTPTENIPYGITDSIGEFNNL